MTYPAAPFLVYAGPGYLFEPFYRVTAGQELAIRGRTGDARWVLVQRPDGREGWLTADIVQPAIPLDQLPVIPGIAPPQGVSWVLADGMEPDETGNGRPLLTRTPPPAATATATATPTATATTPLTETAMPALTGTATPSKPTPGPSLTPTASAGVLVYRAPDESAPPLTQVTAGQSVVILGRTADARWLKIRLPGDIEGWVRAQDVQLNLAVDQLPVISP